MGRKALISEEELLTRICDVFRAKGYVGTSMSDLAAASGLKKASLYHRFPGGKEQMAREVLAGVTAWFQDQVIAPLRAEGPVPERFVRMGLALNAFYDDGHKACLFNRLSAGPQGETGPFHEEIEAAFAAWRNAIIAALGDAGLDRQSARPRRRGARPDPGSPGLRPGHGSGVAVPPAGQGPARAPAGGGLIGGRAGSSSRRRRMTGGVCENRPPPSSAWPVPSWPCPRRRA